VQGTLGVSYHHMARLMSRGAASIFTDAILTGEEAM
jgi:hypothetical protein